ncbi:hypothetical protein E4K64_19440 [Bradyrhizobium frederickii]|uniref:Uncharacterized protein n=1 Tax=Bradyrhizobium frederickii TaxID=2560054 RepID=A0A4Y9P1B8_9BRAD|nr:hypothetical protein E4K64_19440 [Bradyrhizobium frederickii]
MADRKRQKAGGDAGFLFVGMSIVWTRSQPTLAVMPRLDRDIQHAAAPVAAARSSTHTSGILDRSVEPGDDSGGYGSPS